MRVDFVKAIDQVMKRDETSLFITGDLGYNALEGIQSSYPGRFLNAGVAEQNMIGVAAGIALSGHRPWVYSIAPFATYRCMEQIRNDVCLHDLPVRIVGNGGGYTYGVMGSTHHALEDMAVLKALPNMHLYFPCSNNHVAAAVEKMNELSSPAYLRLSISGFQSNEEPFSENAETLTRHYRKGDQVTLIAVGHAAQIALNALPHTLPATHELHAKVDFFGIARFPFDLNADRAIAESVRKTGRVLFVEEHYLAGSISESLRAQLPEVRHARFMTAKYSPQQKYGSSKFHLTQCGLTPENVIENLKELIRA